MCEASSLSINCSSSFGLVARPYIVAFLSRRCSRWPVAGSFPNANTSNSLAQTPTSSKPQVTTTTASSSLISSLRKLEAYNYAVSVPWRKVRQNEEVLLAWEMNGQPLPQIHGGPLRVVVTGYIGARSCKWVYRINALSEPSFGPVQRQEYLYYNQQVCIRCVRLCAAGIHTDM